MSIVSEISGGVKCEEFTEVIKIDEGKVRQHVEEVVRQSVEETLNGLVGRRGRRVLRCEAIRAERRAARHPLRPLSAEVADEGRRGDVERAAFAEPALRDADHRAVQTPRIERRGGIGGDVSGGRVEALGEFFPEAQWQRCVVHWYRNVFTAVPKVKVKAVSAMLKAIHAQEDRPAALGKAEDVAEKLEAMKRPGSCGRAWQRRSATCRSRWSTGVRYAPTIRWSESCVRFGGGRVWSGRSPTDARR